MSTYLYDEFVSTKPGDPYRLFPFGKVVKGGRTRNITPAYAKRFRLPHFLPPIKLGSHEEVTPAGGHIISLSVRGDGNCVLCDVGMCKEHGLWAQPEWNEKGNQAVIDGAYRYQSPEVIWDDGGLEDPKNGTAINGPLILGDALIHTPHLGDSAALYSIEPTKESNMTEEMVTLPKGIWDKFFAPLFTKPAERIEVIKEVVPEDYEAAKTQRDEYKAKIEAQEAALLKSGRVEKFTAELKETKADVTLADMLADLPDDKAEQVMSQFRALSAQIKESELMGEKGTEGGNTEADPKASFNTIVLSIVKEKGINYNAAFEQAKAAHADLFKTAFPK